MPKILATDLDGTLFYPKRIKKCISRKNIKFLRRWIDNNNRLVLITSRSYQFVEKLKKEIDRPFDMMTCTSSQIIANGELIRDISINNEDLKLFLKEVNKEYKPIAYMITTDKHPLIIRNNDRVGKLFLLLYRLYWMFQFSYREPYILDNELFDKTIDEGKIYKVMVCYGLGRNKKKVSKEVNKKLREKYPNLESSWSSVINEITPKDCNKGSGLEYYCSYLHINPDDLYVIGDSGNDISMFNRYYEHSYCMAHAYPSVKKYAKHTLSRVFKLEKIVLKGENYDKH